MKLTVFLLLAPILLAAADPPGELAFLKEFYVKKLEEIDVRIASEKTAPLFEKYDAALAGLEDSVSGEGDLEGLVAIRDERKRARTELGIDPKQIVEKPAKLAEIQKTLAAQTAAIAKARESEVDQVREIYLEKLDALKLTYTKAKKVDEALATVAEIEQIQAERPKESQLAGSSPTKPKKTAKDDDDKAIDLTGRWELLKPDSDKPLAVSLTKIPAVEEGEQRYRMTPSSLGGEYLFTGRFLTKIKEDGDPYWDVIWQKRGDGFFNAGSHYTDWKMSRPEPKDDETDPK